MILDIAARGANMKIKTYSDIRDPSAPYVILFHGYGADASDLRPLADVIPTQKKFNYIFPEGPIQIPLGPHWTGRGWWNIDMARLQNPSLDHDISVEKPVELEQTRKDVRQMILDLKIPLDQIIIGGFSQGGMCAVDQYLATDMQPKGLALLSTALINKEEWRAKGKEKKPVPFFISHGQSDPVLKIKFSDKLQSLLSEIGCKGERVVFQGGHEIPMPILQRLGTWLDSL
jgi:phospholipase/carboxylesterase